MGPEGIGYLVMLVGRGWEDMIYRSYHHHIIIIFTILLNAVEIELDVIILLFSTKVINGLGRWDSDTLLIYVLQSMGQNLHFMD